MAVGVWVSIQGLLNVLLCLWILLVEFDLYLIIIQRFFLLVFFAYGEIYQFVFVYITELKFETG